MINLKNNPYDIFKIEPTQKQITSVISYVYRSEWDKKLKDDFFSKLLYNYTVPVRYKSFSKIRQDSRQRGNQKSIF